MHIGFNQLAMYMAVLIIVVVFMVHTCEYSNVFSRRELNTRKKFETYESDHARLITF